MWRKALNNLRTLQDVVTLRKKETLHGVLCMGHPYQISVPMVFHRLFCEERQEKEGEKGEKKRNFENRKWNRQQAKASGMLFSLSLREF